VIGPFGFDEAEVSEKWLLSYKYSCVEPPTQEGLLASQTLLSEQDGQIASAKIGGQWIVILVIKGEAGVLKDIIPATKYLADTAIGATGMEDPSLVKVLALPSPGPFTQEFEISPYRDLTEYFFVRELGA
jgi:hypothetical protein